MASPLDNNSPQNSKNPLINPPSLPHSAPPLDIVKTEHFLPAVKDAIISANREIAAIKNDPATPTFKNTIEALEFAGQHLSRVSAVFSSIAGANSSDDLRAVETEINVEFVKHGNDIMMDQYGVNRSW